MIDARIMHVVQGHHKRDDLHALFTSTPKPKIFQDFPSHRIFRHMHEVLNIDGKKLIIQFGRNLRDESFKPS